MVGFFHRSGIYTAAQTASFALALLVNGSTVLMTRPYSKDFFQKINKYFSIADMPLPIPSLTIIHEDGTVYKTDYLCNNFIQVSNFFNNSYITEYEATCMLILGKLQLAGFIYELEITI